VEAGTQLKVKAGFSPEEEIGDSNEVKVKQEVENASGSSSTFVFRADDSYTSGPVGLPKGSKEALAAKIQTPLQHVLEKESDDTSRFVSFSVTRKGTLKFTKKGKILKAAWDALQKLKADGVIEILTPEDVKAMVAADPKKSVRKRANDVYQAMKKNDEILIEGQVPEELLQWAK
jgi:hypothetical protein